MGKTKEQLWEEFSMAFWGFEGVYEDYDNRAEAFADPDVRNLFENLIAAYNAWKDCPDKE